MIENYHWPSLITEFGLTYDQGDRCISLIEGAIKDLIAL